VSEDRDFIFSVGRLTIASASRNHPESTRLGHVNHLNFGRH